MLPDMVLVQRSADQQQRHLCFKMDRLDVIQKLGTLFDTSVSICSRRSKNKARHSGRPSK